MSIETDFLRVLLVGRELGSFYWRQVELSTIVKPRRERLAVLGELEHCMPTYKIVDKKIEPLASTTFAKLGFHERRDIQALMRSRIDVLSPETLVVAEEFGEWEESKRRIDLLGIDRDANLVVIELKRTEDGGHMELQAIRYAAMISTLTFEKLIEIYARFLDQNKVEKDAREDLLDFLKWEKAEEELFGQEVRIILASAEFSKELTTSVMWLNDYGLDIRCVRMRPYADGSQVF